MPANTLPADFAGFDELPADFQGFDEGPQADALTTIPAEVQPTGWLEAFFPRATQGGGLTGGALDALSAPGRAYASLARPEGESFPEAMARTAPPAVGRAPGAIGNEWTDRMAETILRDPANIPLAAIATATGGATAPAWLTRLPWAARGLATGTAAGGTVAATRQAENVSAGRPMSATEAGIDVGLGAALGVGGEGLGAGLRAAGRYATPAAIKISKVLNKYQEGVENALPEMFRRNLIGPTAASTERRFAGEGGRISGMYNEATAGSEGLPAVPLSLLGKQVSDDLMAMARKGGMGAQDALAAHREVLSRSLVPETASELPAAGMVDLPTAIKVRSKFRRDAGSYESMAPESPRREALVEGADLLAGKINERIAQVAPEVRAVDQYAAPYYQSLPFIEALGRRSKNFDLGPMELWALAGGAGAGGVSGNVVGGLGAGLGLAGLAKAQRSMLYPYLLNKAGQAGRAIQGAPIAPAVLGVRGSQTDNARGR